MKVEVAEGLMAKIQAADAARFGATPPPNSTPEELDRFMQNLKARGADKPLSEADQMAMVRPSCLAWCLAGAPPRRLIDASPCRSAASLTGCWRR